MRQISANGTDESFWTNYAITPDGNKLLYGERDSTVEGYADGRVDLRMLDLDTGEDTLWGGALPDPDSRASPTRDPSIGAVPFSRPMARRSPSAAIGVRATA